MVNYGHTDGLLSNSGFINLRGIDIVVSHGTSRLNGP